MILGRGTQRRFSMLVPSLCLYFVIWMIKSVHADNATVIYAIIPADHRISTTPSGTLVVEENQEHKIRIVGKFTPSAKVFFTSHDSYCNLGSSTGFFNVTNITEVREGVISGFVSFNLVGFERYMYICISQDFTKEQTDTTHHPEDWLRFEVVAVEEESRYLLPLQYQITLISILLVLSGLFSGLNLGLMALDPTELEIIKKVGSPKEKEYAKKIAPLRIRGNFLLCTLLLGNVMVNSTFTILFDNLTNGLVAIICSTIGIVLCGEIIPQAICSRHGLAVGAKTYFLTRLFMVLTFPISYPVSLILDVVLGEEMGQVYSKEKLQELIRMTADRSVLQSDEANIISGALQLTNKTVEDIMTKIEDVYMLEVNTCLDFDVLAEIQRQGFTRVPVFEGEKGNIVNLLNTKDLTLIDPDDKNLLSTVCKYYDHKPLFVDQDAKLDAMLQDFLQGKSNEFLFILSC